jgi:hypothetical protein
MLSKAVDGGGIKRYHNETVRDGKGIWRDIFIKNRMSKVLSLRRLRICKRLLKCNCILLSCNKQVAFSSSSIIEGKNIICAQ